MNPNLSKAAPLLIAVLCITAIGVSATTLETSLSTDPDEEIDPAWEKLPIGQDDAYTIQQEMESGDDDSSDDGSSSESSAASEQQQSSQSQASSASSADDSSGAGASPPSLLDKLISFLVALLRFLVAVAALVGAAALAYRYRDRIEAALWGLLQPNEDPAAVEYTEDPWPEESPSNVVERAWVALVREVDPERPSVMTPSECAAAAREAGLDSGAVETITDAFERVEYGGVPATDEQDRVEDALDRIRNTRRRGRIGGAD
jgi:hypothetical protein